MSNSSVFNNTHFSASSSSSTIQPQATTTSHNESGFQPSASNPAQSIFPSPASNPAVTLLEARARIAQEAEEEFEGLGRRGAPGRKFLDVVTIRQILMMRDEQGKGEAEIESKFGLRKGVVGKLGGRGVLSGAGA
jgi:hypothetical protein